MKKINTFFIIVLTVLIGLQFYSQIRIGRLTKEMDSLKVMNRELNHNIDEIYNNVDEKLKKQNSRVSSFRYEVGNFDLETYRVPVIFHVEPKKITEDTKVFLKFGKERLEMKKEDITFSVKRNFELGDRVAPTLILAEGDTEYIESNPEVYIDSLKDYVFPMIDVEFSGTHGRGGKNKYEIDGNLNVEFDRVMEAMKIIKLEYRAYVEGKLVDKSAFENEQVVNMELDKRYNLTEGQNLITKVVAENENGFSHEFIFLNILNEPNSIHKNIRSEKIISPYGDVLWEDVY